MTENPCARIFRALEMSRIPRFLDPLQPRSLNQTWQGVFGRQELPRLAGASLGEAPFHVRVDMVLVRGSLGEVRLQATIAGECGLRCQRCLQPMSWCFALEPDVVMTDPNGSAVAIGDGQDVVELDADGLLRPADFVEEEILLALPLSPRHDDCGEGIRREFVPGEGGGEAGNPFAVLKKLRKPL